MADDKKKIIKRFELFTPPDSIEQYLIFSMSLNLDSLNNIFKTNTGKNWDIGASE